MESDAGRLVRCTCHPGVSDAWVPPHPQCPIHGEGGLSALVPDPPSLPSE